MSNRIKQIQALRQQKREVEDKITRRQGALKQLRSSLKKHGCKNVEEARAKVQELETRLQKIDKKMTTKLDDIGERWGEKLKNALGRRTG